MTRASRGWGATRRVLTLASACAALGCGSAHPAGWSSSPGDATDASSQGASTSGDDASTAAGDAGLLVLTSGDAAPAGVAFACEPGTYAGMFTTTVTTDAGLFPSLLSFNWMGNLSISLIGHVSQGSNGEDFAAPTLTIAPGAMLAGTDNFGGRFTAGLSGQLDCPSKTLTGTLSNGQYDYPYDAGSITMVGTLSGAYDGTMTPPALTAGQIAVGSPMFSTLGATGSWSATLQ
jgi:hypothetical protein